MFAASRPPETRPYAAVLPYEYAHSFMAFALGLKSQPLAIHFVSSSLVNILLLSNIDEHVDYDNIFAQVPDRQRPPLASLAQWPTAPSKFNSPTSGHRDAESLSCSAYLGSLGGVVMARYRERCLPARCASSR
jgi:hypothetical protein